MSSEILSGTGAAAGIALINSVGNLGGFLGPYLVGLVRKQTDSFALALLALAIWPLIGAAVTAVTRLSTARSKEPGR
jgi:nitrate/nitrite transporter NarK